jgi:hypothetical protein
MEEDLKKALTFIAVLLLVGVFVAAQDLGAINGKVVDEDGTPLPGVSVTLTGSRIAAMSTISSEGGNFRFLSLPGGDDYMLKLELSGFKTVTREKLNVSFGRDTTLNITLEQSAIEEEITVIGQSPVIDTKRTQVGVNITEEMIMSMPTARNPWVIMSLVPGMLISKEDVGGNEAGQQSSYTGHGSIGADQTWNIDGANITDNSALGAAPAYLNLSSYEELQINYGNNDVKSQTGGVQLNFVSRRGGNNFSGNFYLDVSEEDWGQAYNGTPELEELYPTYNPGLSRVYLYGANFGGPIVRDKAWFYGSYGIQDINARNIDATTDSTWLMSAYTKLNFQVTSSTRAEIFFEYDNKLKYGRNDWFELGSAAPSLRWNQDGPGYIWKGELEQMFGDLYLNAKALWIDMSFFLHPYEESLGTPLTISYYPTYYVYGALDDYGTTRTSANVNLTGNYFVEDVLGADHEIKFGVDYIVSTVTSYDYYDGNAYLYYYGPDDWFPTGEYWEASIQRDLILSEWLRRYSFFIQDTMTFGKLSINLGIRYDNETSKVKDEIIPESKLLPHLLPGLNIKEIDPGMSWSVLSPRFSIIYDITGDGKNVIKINLARYGSQEGFGMGHFFNPADWAGIGVYWQDLNSDGLPQNDELYGEDDDGNLVQPVTAYNRIWKWGTLNLENPNSTDTGNRIDPNFNSPLLDELTIAFEKELATDFALRLEGFYKKSHNGIWDRPMLLDGTKEPLFSDSNPNYVDTGEVEPETGQKIWGIVDDYDYFYRTNYQKRHSKYLAGQVVLIKRLSNRWMLDASFTYSSWKRYYEGEYTDPHNIWHFEGGVNANMNSRWQFKTSGLYQFPFGINASWVFRAREGYVLQPYVKEQRPGLGNSTFYDGVRGDNRLPAFYELDLRLEKVFQIGERSRVILSADAFNALNSNHELNRDQLITSDRFDTVNKILNPRVFRFGIRFDF